jgi:hypothetical protein
LTLIYLVCFAVQIVVQTIAGAIPGAIFSAATGFSHGAVKGASDLAATWTRDFQDLGGPKLVAACENGVGWAKNAVMPSVTAAVSAAYWLFGLQANATLEKKSNPELAWKNMFHHAQVVTRVVTEISDDEENVKRELMPMLISDNLQYRLQAKNILDFFQFLPRLAAQGRLISGDSFWKRPLEDALKTQRLEISGFRQRISTLRTQMAVTPAREIKWWHWWKTRHSTEASRIGKALHGALEQSKKTMATILNDVLEHVMSNFAQSLRKHLCRAKREAGAFMGVPLLGETSLVTPRETSAEDISNHANEQDAKTCSSESMYTTFNPLGRVLVRASMACDVGKQIEPHVKRLKNRLRYHQETLDQCSQTVAMIQKWHSRKRSSHDQTIDQLALLERQVKIWEVLVESWYSE